jgi:hypothetical protein
VELKGLEWRVARVELKELKWSERDRTGVESGQIGVEESGMEWSGKNRSGEWPDRSGGEWSGVESSERTGVESGQTWLHHVVFAISCTSHGHHAEQLVQVRNGYQHQVAVTLREQHLPSYCAGHQRFQLQHCAKHVSLTIAATAANAHKPVYQHHCTLVGQCSVN